jgi:phosphatidylserine decarboxylase
LVSKYGYDVVATLAVLLMIGAILTWTLIDSDLVRFPVIAILVFLLTFTLYFFRDPDRKPPGDDALVVAPADGKIILIAPIHDDEYVKEDAVQVSIFMSPLNVHVNRYPITGKVGYFRHFQGEFLVAFDDKASLRNERTHIGVENTRVKVLFKQIAGFVARRIVAPVKVGDSALQGERFGMIKFGSRVDVILPARVRLRVNLGDLTVAGETVIADIV